MMHFGNDLTMEYLKKYFKNPFELTNFAIQIATERLAAGEEENLGKIMEELEKRCETLAEQK